MAPQRDIKAEIAGREAEVLGALGIAWPPRGAAKHIRCPFPDHEDKNPSWRWDGEAGKWFCSCGSGDILDAVQRMGRAQDFIGAADFARDVCGLEAPASKRANRANGHAGAHATSEKATKPEWQPIHPVPKDAHKPPKTHYKFGAPSQRWPYQNAQDRLIGYVCRFDFPDGSKEIWPLTYCQHSETGELAWRWKAFAKPRPLYGLELLADKPYAPVLLVEGEKTADAAEALFPDHVTVTWPGGTGAAGLADWSALQGRDVVIWPDHDEPGRKAATRIATSLEALKNVAVRIVDTYSVDADWLDGWDIADAPPAGVDVRALVDAAKAPEIPKSEAKIASPMQGESTHAVPHRSVGEVLEIFESWLHLPDPAPLYAMLGTVAANMIEGDPVWLGLIAPPSSAKTELLNALVGLRDVHEAATITPASLLSGTPKRERDGNAKGGLLRQIGEFGFLIAKDFTSVLSMRPDAKGEMLAALREIYDGRWTRHIGTEGGRALEWSGKIGLLFGCTQAIDDHHGVMGELGARFLLCRTPPSAREQARMARKHTGARTAQMRRELSEAVQGLFASPVHEPEPPDDTEWERLENMAIRAVQLRSAVVRDRHSREIEAIHDHEGPARLMLTLERLVAGLAAIGFERGEAIDVAERLARDSVPPIRRAALEYVEKSTADAPHLTIETKDVAKSLGLPTTTVRRALEDLAAQRLLKRESGGSGKADHWVKVVS